MALALVVETIMTLATPWPLKIVFEGLSRLRQGRTTSVIAHRISTVRQADLIRCAPYCRGLYAQFLVAQCAERRDM